MADKPVNELRTKNADDLALEDYLIGHDDGQPAAFRATLSAVAGALTEPLGASLPDEDAFIEALITRIIGPGPNALVEVGTFTPSLVISSGPIPGITYGTRSGYYQRVGDVVMFMIDLTVASISSPPANQAQITGFPIPRVGQSGAYYPYVENIAISGLGAPLIDWVSDTNLRLIQLNNNAGPSSVLVSAFGSNARVKVTGLYSAATP